MKSKIVIILLLCLTAYTSEAQDIRSTVLTIPNWTANNHRIRTVIRTGSTSIRNIRVYYELHTNNAPDNPIAQVGRVENFNFLQRLLGRKTVFVIFDNAMLRGFTINDATKVVVICDPKLEITETNESNNTRVTQIN
jgi:hypothetical protein